MLITIKLFVLWSQNFQEYTLKHFQTGGRAPGAPALDPPLLKVVVMHLTMSFFLVFIRNISLSPHDDPLTLTEGTSKKVTCSVNSDAYPIPVIRWFIGDTEISITKETLDLTADIIHDGKMLRCLASNNDKSLNKTTFLNILCMFYLFSVD